MFAPATFIVFCQPDGLRENSPSTWYQPLFNHRTEITRRAPASLSLLQDIGHALQSLNAHLTNIERTGNKIESSGAKLKILVAGRDQELQVTRQQEMVDRLLDQASAQKETNAKVDGMASSSSPSRGLSVRAP